VLDFLVLHTIVFILMEGTAFLTWVAFGAVVGALAGAKRGFSPIVGLAAGAFLGILSPLLFGVSELATRGEFASKECPRCAERISSAAKICKHCRHRVPDDSAHS
jgi:hypothetical protein